MIWRAWLCRGGIFRPWRRQYLHTPNETGTVKDGDQPYMTRMVVRRPANPKRFNGTVVVEWDNVTNQFDAENVWFFDWEHMMREGYVWVGVSAQTVGVNALQKLSPTRYGELDVGKTAGEALVPARPDADAISYDIFSQVGEAIRHPGSVDMLHGLKPKLILATGESQSADRLATYVNSIHPLARVYDGFLLLSAVGRKSAMTCVPVIKISTEFDVTPRRRPARSPTPPNSAAGKWRAPAMSTSICAPAASRWSCATMAFRWRRPWRRYAPMPRSAPASPPVMWWPRPSTS